MVAAHLAQVVVDGTHLADHGRTVASRRVVIELLTGTDIEVAVVAAQHVGSPAGGGTVKKLLLLGDDLAATTVEVGHDAAGVFDIDIGKVGIVFAESEEMLAAEEVKLVAHQLGMEQAQELEGVDAAVVSRKGGFGKIAAEVVDEDLVVVLDIVTHQTAVADVVDKLAQCLGMADEGGVAPLFDDGVGDVAEHLGDGALGLDMHHKGGALDHAAMLHLDSGYLQDVVVEDAESGGLGIEDHHGSVGVDGSHKVLHVGGGVVEQKIGGQEGAVEHLAHKLAGRGGSGKDAQSIEQACPCHEVGLRGKHIEMGEHGLDLD